MLLTLVIVYLLITIAIGLVAARRAEWINSDRREFIANQSHLGR